MRFRNGHRVDDDLDVAWLYALNSLNGAKLTSVCAGHRRVRNSGPEFILKLRHGSKSEELGMLLKNELEDEYTEVEVTCVGHIRRGTLNPLVGIRMNGVQLIWGKRPEYTLLTVRSKIPNFLDMHLMNTHWWERSIRITKSILNQQWNKHRVRYPAWKQLARKMRITVNRSNECV